MSFKSPNREEAFKELNSISRTLGNFTSPSTFNVFSPSTGLNKPNFVTPMTTGSSEVASSIPSAANNSPLTPSEEMILSILQPLVEAHNAKLGPAPSIEEFTLYASLTSKLVKCWKSESPCKPFVLPSSFSPQTLTVPLASTQPHTMSVEISMVEMNTRLTLIDKVAANLKVALVNIISLSYSDFACWNSEGKEILSFFLIVSNTLAQAGVKNDLWIPSVLKALQGSKILTHFTEFHSLPLMSSSGIFHLKLITPEDINSWSFELFMAEFFRLFRDNRFMENISMHLNSWNTSSFKDANLAMVKYKDMMSQLTLYQSLSGHSCDYDGNCKLYIHYFWSTLSTNFLKDFAPFCKEHTGHLPLDAKSKASFLDLDRAISIHAEYSSAMARHAAVKPAHSIHKQISSIASVPTPGPSTTPSVPFVRNPHLICTHCLKPGHLADKCFILNPSIVSQFICKTCKQLGHLSTRCPNKSS